MTYYEAVASYFNSLNIHYSKDWVVKCIESVKSSNPFLPSNDLCSAVYRKWLLVNLRDIRVPSLPANLLSRENFTLTGSYVVQMESMVDSSKSSYSELCKIRDPDKICENNEESKEEAVSKRCLVFVFCDGVQEIQGMEYQYIPSLKVNDPGILPGVKILIVGPVICRKGMLLLKKNNVKIYGGKVEKFCETNCLESLLCKKLGLEYNLNQNNSSQTAETDVFVNYNELDSNVPASSFSRSETTNIDNDEIDELLSDDDDILLSLTLDSNNILGDNSEKSHGEMKISEEIDNDELKQNTNIMNRGLVCENENQLFNNKLLSDAYKKSQRQEDTSYFGACKKARISATGCRDDPYEEIALQSDCIADDLMFDSALNPSTSGGNQKFNVANSKKSVAAKNFLQRDISSYLSSETRESCQSSNTHRKFPLTVTSYPFVYLKQIVDNTLTEPVIFIVKAIILTLKSKIIMKNDEFALMAVISDGSYAIQVNFSSDILENIMEYSPCEIASFMSQKNKNTAVSEKLKSIFLSAQQKLLSMNCLMEIKFFNDGHIPLVIKLEEIQFHHVNSLKGRMLCN